MQRVAHQVSQKNGVAPGVFQHLCTQSVQQAGLPVHGAQIKEHTGQHEGLGVGLLRPLPEVAVPALQGLAPVGVGGHDIARAVDVATGIQPVAGPAGQGTEVFAVLGLVVARIEHQTVVLVGLGRLLAARLRPCRHPHVRNGRRPQHLFAQFQQAAGQGIGHRGHHLPRAVGRRTRCCQVLLQMPDLGTAALQAFQRGLLTNLAGKEYRRSAVPLRQVSGGDDAQHILAIRHGDVVDVVPRHEQQGIEGGLVRLHRERGQGGNVHHRALWVQPCRQHAVAQVAVGHQTKEHPIGPNEHRRRALLAHALRGFLNGAFRRQQQRRAAQQLAHGRGQQAGVEVGHAGMAGRAVPCYIGVRRLGLIWRSIMGFTPGPGAL